MALKGKGPEGPFQLSAEEEALAPGCRDRRPDHFANEVGVRTQSPLKLVWKVSASAGHVREGEGQEH